MSDPAGERRLGAIMFTDVVGYSSITSVDERRALRLLDEHRGVLSSVFQKYGGRVVKTIGDGFLVEFASAVEAVNCAVDAQRQMSNANQGREAGDRVSVRIGIHVGDVVHSGGDVLGDAVNVAARVQPVAEAGGICVTRQVVDQVERKVDAKLVRIGVRELKNIRYPVELYRVEVSGKTASVGEQTLDQRRLAILPFTNLSGDPEDRYFADGMTEELIATVSRIGELSVISRTSVMRYKDRSVSIGEIGVELSAGSVLEGSVRRAGNKVRITVQLIDARSERHLWAQSYDRDLTDVFAIQADIAEKVAEALKVQLLSKEKAGLGKKRPVDPEAYTLYLKGRTLWNERTQDAVTTALKHFEEAVKIDPGFAEAYSGLADCYLILADYRHITVATGIAEGKKYARKAIELDEALAEGHASMGLALGTEWEFEAAVGEFNRALELRPNYAFALHWSAFDHYFLGLYDESFELELKAAALDPYSLPIACSLSVLYMERGRQAEALERLDRLATLNPNHMLAYFWRSFARTWAGRNEEAIADARRCVELGEETIALLQLAWVLASAGKVEEAVGVLDKAQSRPDAANMWAAYLGAVQLLVGRDAEGFASMQRALKKLDNKLFTFGVAPSERKFLGDPRWKAIEAQLKKYRRSATAS
ncbi:MAG: tetratricopeptide repeat protein [archaeon]|nr:MAG: tetratricopeptide repeat protein [archaeon]